MTSVGPDPANPIETSTTGDICKRGIPGTDRYSGIGDDGKRRSGSEQTVAGDTGAES